jgi:predicted nucleic acid-binding protein
MAQIAAKVDADARKTGQAIPFWDLLIGATALHPGSAAGTRNPRHFRMISDLAVLSI